MSTQLPRILAIDDAPAILRMLGSVLGNDFELQFATSGLAGIALALATPPDLILLDVMMPEMDGFETCRQLKAHSSLKNIPVIFVTALGEIESEAKGLALGAADYISKPINVEIARQRIRNLLEREQLRKAAEEQRDDLQTVLKEKEFLLHEVHHRVKNNLQVITSLLRLESGRSDQAATKLVLSEMQGRIHSMGLLHETLYRSSHFTEVDLGVYLKELGVQVFRMMNIHGGAVRLELDLAPVKVGIDQATSCGLLVNELLSNGLKHGFPDQHGGDVRVELHPVAGTTHACLSVSDSGVGLAADFESRRQHSLGLSLASDLARQMGGKLEIESEPRTRFSVKFAVHETKAVRAA
jgi:two-component sensor histidine kinase/CheY-like chemotaxis protein